MNLAQQHIAKGSGHTTGEFDEQQMIEQFEENSEIYEKIVREANVQKQELRKVITEMDIDLRHLREKVADKQVENKNLRYLLSREEEMKKKQNAQILSALEMLEELLEDELRILQESSEKVNNKVTPYGMSEILQAKMRKASTSYEKFISDS